jgi:phage-related protein
MDVVFLDAKTKADLLSLEKPSISKSLKLIKLLEKFGNKLGMPYSKQILHNLYELRAREQQEIRIFYCLHQNQAVVVHFFIKKSQKTPQREIKTALARIYDLTST